LGAHFLDLRGLLFQLSRENVDRFRRPLQWCRSKRAAPPHRHLTANMVNPEPRSPL
jgi:hypothetical protein